VHLLAESGADLSLCSVQKCNPVHMAAQVSCSPRRRPVPLTALPPQGGHLDIVRYLASKAPALIDVPNRDGTTPLMTAAASRDFVRESGGTTESCLAVACHLLRLGCSLANRDWIGLNASGLAFSNRNVDMHLLLTAVESAGGWRQYAAAARMAYVRIRHEVSKTYVVLDEGHDDRALLHFLFGRNRAVVDDAEEGDVLDEAFDACFEKPKAMLVLPDEVFRLVCRFLEG
jgi:hypothetical protein